MMLNTKQTLKVSFCLLIFCSLFHSQSYATDFKTPAEEFEYYKNKYPEDNAVITNYWRKLNIRKVADSIQVLMEQYQEILILDNALQWAKDKSYSSSFSKLEEIEAYTLLPEKKKYKKVPVEEFKRAFDTNTFVFYDDSETISYNYPQLVEGAKIVTKQTTSIRDPHMIGQFFFLSYVPTASVKYEIITDDDIQINHGIYNKELIDVQILFEKNENNGTVVYAYSGTSLPKVENDAGGPSYSYLSPSIYNTVASYKDVNGKEVKVLSSIEDLHNWYRTFIEGLGVDEETKKIAASIVDSGDSDIEKIRKIFYWVQKNVKYIAFEQGMRGFIPHSADYVVEKRYGDCKDMTSILVALLRSQDLPAHFTWIGSRDLPYKYSDLPSPVVDNHMIASVELDGKTIFLDATGSYSPLGFPTSMIQGKESLISKGESFRIVEVPVIPKEQNLMIDTAYVTLNEGTVSGSGSLELTGLVKVANSYRLINRSNKKTEDYLRRLLSRGSNKFFLDEFDVANVDDLDKPIVIDYKFSVGDYYKEIGDEIYVNLCLDKSLVNNSIKDRKTPLENDYQYVNRNVTILEIPGNYEVSYLPDDVKVDTDNFGFEITYEKKGDQIVATKEFYVSYLLLETDSFAAWNKANKKYSQTVRNTIVLKKTSN
ncbi:MAG: transglutaminase domain-containing protein [Bacteroidota bacterium]